MNEFIDAVEEMDKDLREIRILFDIAVKKQKITGLEKETARPDLWENHQMHKK